MNKTREMYSSLSLKAISFVVFRQTKGELYHIEIGLLISLGNFQDHSALERWTCSSKALNSNPVLTSSRIFSRFSRAQILGNACK